MKAVLVLSSLFLSLNLSAQKIEIGSSLDYTLMWVKFLKDRQNYEYSFKYYDGKITEVIIEYTDIISYDYNSRITVDKRYIFQDDTVFAIAEHYYNVSSAQLRLNAKKYSLDCEIISDDGSTWLINKDLKKVSKIFIESTNGTASELFLSINSELVPNEVRLQAKKCEEKTKELELQIKQQQEKKEKEREEQRRQQIKSKIGSGYYFNQNEVQQGVKSINNEALKDFLFQQLILAVDSGHIQVRAGIIEYEFILKVNSVGEITALNLEGKEMNSGNSVFYDPARILGIKCNSMTSELLQVDVTGERISMKVKVKKDGSMRWKGLKGKFEPLATNPALKLAIQNHQIKEKGVFQAEGRKFDVALQDNAHQTIYIDELTKRQSGITDILLFCAGIAGIALLI